VTHNHRCACRFTTFAWRINEHRWLWVPAQGRDDGGAGICAQASHRDIIKIGIMRDITRA